MIVKLTKFRKNRTKKGTSILIKFYFFLGFTGCSPYYPEDTESEVTFTPFTISLKHSNDDPHFSEKRLVIAKDGESETREVIHLQFKSWPNYGVPEETGHIADFVRLAYLRANHEVRGYSCHGRIRL